MRTILHIDMNSCYANIELLYRPELRDRPVAVGGDPEQRHGIVLAKNQLAKRAGVKTAMALWEARQACPDIVFLPPDYPKYLYFSRIAGEIYGEYTDLREPFGIDECWADVSDSTSVRGDGLRIAEEIRRRIRAELGVTVSIGVSWNKIFAKLGSDYKKPDAVTVISRENYRSVVWPLPASDLLYVGPAMTRKLRGLGIRTIGELAAADPVLLTGVFGKIGLVLHVFANGEDLTPVNNEFYETPVKSIGNSTTTPRDLVTEEDVRITLYILAESVAERLKDNGFKGRMIGISVRDSELWGFTRQCRAERPTDISTEIAETAFRLFRDNYSCERPIRSIGVRAGDLVDANAPDQTDLFHDEILRDKLRRTDIAVGDIRRRFGFYTIQRGLMYCDPQLSHVNAREDHIIHPHGYFEDGNRVFMPDRSAGQYIKHG